MTSIVIAAHDEASVIGRCLESLFAAAEVGEFDVTVVANGCTDTTAQVAASIPGVRVLEVKEASKPAALNAGDQVAVGYPRVYLDADMSVTAEDVRAVTAALTGGSARTDGARGRGTLAAVPRRELDLAGRPLVVRCYFAVNARLPAFREGLFGRGMIAVSEAGRACFDRFPDMVADDLFLDSLFSDDEKCQVDRVCTVVATPRRSRDLLRRLVRVRRGNAAMRGAARDGRVAVRVRSADRTSWWWDVVAPRPWLAPAAVVYVGVSVLAAIGARLDSSGDGGWGRDESTRRSTQDESRGRRLA